MVNVSIDRTSILNGKYKLVSSKDSHITIGKYCAVADGLKIITLNHDYNYPVLQGTFYKQFFGTQHPGELKSPPSKTRTKGHVVIGHDVWIGEDVFITSGVKIGHGCCIGARSVVTGDLPSYSICVGSPCRVIKSRYSPEVVEALLNIEWWNWTPAKIRANKTFFETDLNSIDLKYILECIVE